MSDEPKKRSPLWSWWWVIPVVPTLYVASLFPTVWTCDALMKRGYLPVRTVAAIDTFYAPIVWVMQHSPVIERTIRSGLPHR